MGNLLPGCVRAHHAANTDGEFNARRIPVTTVYVPSWKKLTCGEFPQPWHEPEGGVAVLRYILRVEPIASASTDDLVNWLAPALDLYFTGQDFVDDRDSPDDGDGNVHRGVKGSR